MKDPAEDNYKRAVQKIFVAIAFIGGLIGAVMAGLFIMNSYTSFAYEVVLAMELFKESEESATTKKIKYDSHGTINIFHFLKYYFFIIVKYFRGYVN